MEKLSNLWRNFVNLFFQFLPTFVVCLNFMPSGLVFGYTISSFVAERNSNAGLVEYGPMILGACFGCVIAFVMFFVKICKGRIMFWHIYPLLTAGGFNLLASCFYFANGFDRVGAFLSYLAHSLTFIAGLSFLHSIPGKNTRALSIAVSFSFYLMGMAAAVSLIGPVYDKNQQRVLEGKEGAEDVTSDIYVDFAAVYLSLAIVTLAALIGIKVLHFFGTVDYENPMDNDFRIANSNSTVFEKREEIIKRIEFFYVTKNQQWNVTLLLIFTEAIQYSLFVYYIFWFSMNGAIRLTEIKNIDAMLWVIYAGSVVTLVSLMFFSFKINFVMNQSILIALTIISMIIGSSVQTTVPLWLILFFFGMNFCNLQIGIVEVSHFRFTELLIYASYLLKLLSTSVVYYYFVSDSKNSFFYSTDESTLMAQGFTFIIIAALQALVVGMKVPRTYRTSLFDIQYGLLGIIFTEHQIEQLNVKWINDGTIPTISQ